MSAARVFSWVLGLLCLLPRSSPLGWVRVYRRLVAELLHYSVWRLMDRLRCHRVYEAKGLCSARDHGIRGLGTELVRRWLS